MVARVMFAFLACSATGFASVNARRLRAFHPPTSPPVETPPTSPPVETYPCNPNTHNGLVCSDGFNDGRTGSFGEWDFCGVKGSDGRWAERKYCPAGFYQCENGFCGEKASECKLFPVKYGPGMCEKPTSPPVETYPCNPNTHNGLVCSDGRTGSFGEWDFCGVKGSDGRWAERKYCPAGFYQCENGFCGEKASECKLFPVKYGPGMCEKPACDEADTVESLACRAGQTVEEWCVANDPGAVNCDNGDFGINGLACSHSTCLGLRPKPTPPPCDEADTVESLACRAGQTVEEWCVANDPGAVNCDNGDFGINGLACSHSTCLGLRPKPTPCELEKEELQTQINTLNGIVQELEKEKRRFEERAEVLEKGTATLVNEIKKLRDLVEKLKPGNPISIPGIPIDIPGIPGIPGIPTIPGVPIFG